MEISKSKDFNPNYLAKVVEIKNLRPHSNADRLQVAIVDFQEVIIDISTKIGDICVFFPLECQINADFLQETNSYASQLLNKDTNIKGYFDKNGRVRATKLRGEKSQGYLVPVKTIEEFFNCELLDKVSQEFDTIGNVLICKKYKLPVKGMNTNDKVGKKPKISRLIDGQVRLHIDTEQLERNAHKVNLDDDITITYKLHGTSGWVSHVLVKKELNLIEKILKKFGVRIIDTEYDFIYGSRKVVKNSNMRKTNNNFYDCNVWLLIKEELKEFVPKNYTIYYEALEFTPSGSAIQKNYDYGCKQGEKKVFVYRITVTNPCGMVIDLSSLQVKEFCDRAGLNYVPLLYRGRARDLVSNPDAENWREEFISELRKRWTEKDCYICQNKVPEEGIVLRKEGLFGFEAYKLKSFRFLQHETEMLDNGEVDIESVN
jgi:RNA ligase (TIGR02306 family)